VETIIQKRDYVVAGGSRAKFSRAASVEGLSYLESDGTQYGVPTRGGLNRLFALVVTGRVTEEVGWSAQVWKSVGGAAIGVGRWRSGITARVRSVTRFCAVSPRWTPRCRALHLREVLCSSMLDFSSARPQE
jgi:hypothetical protein